MCLSYFNETTKNDRLCLDITGFLRLSQSILKQIRAQLVLLHCKTIEKCACEDDKLISLWLYVIRNAKMHASNMITIEYAKLYKDAVVR